MMMMCDGMNVVGIILVNSIHEIDTSNYCDVDNGWKIIMEKSTPRISMICRFQYAS